MTQTLPDSRVTNIVTAERDAHQRNEAIEGLRALAELLERNPHLILPHDGPASPLAVIPHGAEEQREQLAAWAKALPGKKQKDGTSSYFTLVGHLRGVGIQIICDRAEVCERVVTGTTEVEVSEPDPDAVAALPKVTRTETIETVEWRCHPVLDAEREQPAVTS